MISSKHGQDSLFYLCCVLAIWDLDNAFEIRWSLTYMHLLHSLCKKSTFRNRNISRFSKEYVLMYLVYSKQISVGIDPKRNESKLKEGGGVDVFG